MMNKKTLLYTIACATVGAGLAGLAIYLTKKRVPHVTVVTIEPDTDVENTTEETEEVVTSNEAIEVSDAEVAGVEMPVDETEPETPVVENDKTPESIETESSVEEQAS